MPPFRPIVDTVFLAPLFLGTAFFLSCESAGLTADSDVAQSSGVIITIDKPTYQQQDTIRVTIENRLDTTVTTIDQQSFCSIVTLEREAEDNWTPTMPCTLNAPAREVSLAPREQSEVELAGGPQHPVANLPPGRYRATFKFTPGENFLPASPETQTISSEEFLIE